MRRRALFYWRAAEDPAHPARLLLSFDSFGRFTTSALMARAKIFYLISSLAQGGAERHLLDLARHLDPDRFASDICVLKDQSHFQGDVPAGQPRYRLRSRGSSWRCAPRSRRSCTRT
jgi:hypothetical protein